MNKKLEEYLNKSINENSMSHAFLIETNDIDKTRENIFLILLEKDIIDNQKCLNNNISIKNILPEENIIEKSKILDLQKFIVTTTFNNHSKVYFINNAELMNESSSNKLLKTLEEPVDNVFGFLLTNNINSVMSTIKSRCEIFYDNLYKNDIINNSIINKLLEINTIKFKDIILLKKEILTYDRNNIIEILTNYKKLNKNSDDYLIINDIIQKLKANTNIELCIDNLLIELRR